MEHDGDEVTTDAGEQILPWARAVLETTGPRWLRLTQTVPDELLTRIPAPDEWSAVDCLRHLLEVERTVFPVRVRAIL
ncbi:MAG TPA: DinB family protein, partial [Ktedonobacterales bacterium]|nr:DinB family protein [Ktedonobacterales bacterium]